MSERSAKFITLVLALPALLLPASCLLYILFKGIPALHWEMLSSGVSAVAFGTSGSLWPQISGSLLLMFGACLLAAPVALGMALFYALCADARQQRWLLSLLHLLQGIPPIVYGLCGLIVLVHLLHWGMSLLTGMTILAVIILPMLVLNTVHAIDRIPIEQSEAARSLGLSSGQIIRRVWLPAAWSSLLTGLLLGMARALSETAPILFTATVFSGVTWPDSLFSPVSSLQTHIFYLAQEGANAAAVDIAWASAVILVALVTTLSLVASALRRVKSGRIKSDSLKSGSIKVGG
ncbi:MAG: ABC transporter permease subunit [Mariprofundaceae bacterium]|nr:ABC transporter permease subunit [Mariprofundaceae bacterium]